MGTLTNQSADSNWAKFAILGVGTCCCEWTHECVCIQEDALAVLSQSPAVDLSEGDAEFGASQQRKVEFVPAVHSVHRDNLVKCILKGQPVGAFRKI